jgi:hypothetical protein
MSDSTKEKQVKTLKLSTIALLTAMLAGAPVGAASLNLRGGDASLLSLGGSGTSSVITLDTGNLLSGSTGGSGSNSTLVDATLGGSGSSEGALLEDATASVKVDLGGSSDSGTLLDLFGDGGDPIVASVNLGASDGTTANVLLDLFGNGSDSSAKLSLDNGQSVGGLSGTDGGAILDLFGNQGPNGGNRGSGTGQEGNGSSTGGIGGSETSGNGAVGSGTGLRVASIDAHATANAKACFSPDTAQIAKLVSRHQYGPATFSAWASVKSLKIINVGLCTRAAATITGEPNIGHLQAFISGNATIRAGLTKQGHSPSDVIAVDKSGNTLVLYVI